MRQTRHEGIEARRHEVVKKAKGIKCGAHLRTLSLNAWSPLRAYMPSCLRASYFSSPSNPRAPRRTIDAQNAQNEPMCHSVSHPAKPAANAGMQNKPTNLHSCDAIEDFPLCAHKTKPSAIQLPFQKF
jgi:hypothetical protein